MKRKCNLDAIDIINSVFPKIAEFLINTEVITLATIHPSLVKFASQYHPMMYNLWGKNPHSPSVKFYEALRLLHWGKWGKAHSGKKNNELCFNLKVMNVVFLAKINIHDFGMNVTCKYKHCYYGYSETSFPNIIPRHQVRKTLFLIFDTLFQDIQVQMFRLLQDNPWMLVNEKNAEQMTSKKWFEVAHQFEQYEEESQRFDQSCVVNLNDHYSIKNVFD
jgi:hypothetical protein